MTVFHIMPSRSCHTERVTRLLVEGTAEAPAWCSMHEPNYSGCSTCSNCYTVVCSQWIEFRSLGTITFCHPLGEVVLPFTDSLGLCGFGGLCSPLENISSGHPTKLTAMLLPRHFRTLRPRDQQARRRVPIMVEISDEKHQGEGPPLVPRAAERTVARG